MEHYILFLEFGDSYLEKRDGVRNAHLSKAWEAAERGELILAGALTDPIDSALILFSAKGPEAAEQFALNDPYVQNGLVKKWYVRKWHTTVGLDASSPVRPSTPS
ncbi:MAG: YciI-like protein [Pseudomonas sp.]|uniref:YciI-like protein n=1 Tax=Pseudomonas sp. TaxID=306 RepID=UPI003D6FA68D